MTQAGADQTRIPAIHPDGTETEMEETGDLGIDRQVELARKGHRRALSRLITLALKGLPDKAYRIPFPNHIVGITGPPGVGKSTILGRLAEHISGKTAILAVDPVSPFSGGSFLADRIRMGELGDNVFFRSLSSSAMTGGLTRGIGRVLRILAAAGFETVFVETVGTGQDEFAVHTLADTVVVIEAPGLGDDIQALKMGLLEVADIYVVNKKNQPGADVLAGHLRAMLETSRLHCRICRAIEAPDCGWTPPILLTSATTGDGIDQLSRALSEHRRKHAREQTAFERFRKLSEATREINAVLSKARDEILAETLHTNSPVPDIVQQTLLGIARKLSADPTRSQPNREQKPW